LRQILNLIPTSVFLPFTLRKIPDGGGGELVVVMVVGPLGTEPSFGHVQDWPLAVKSRAPPVMRKGAPG
jgi:hypothetical protein